MRQTARRTLSLCASLLLGTASATAGAVLASQPAAAEDSPVTRYAPVLFLTGDEKYGPVDATRFVEGSTLNWSHDQGCADHTDEGWSPVDPARLGSGGYDHRAGHRNNLMQCRHEGSARASNTPTRPRDGGAVGLGSAEGFYLNYPNDLHGSTDLSNARVYYEYVPRVYVTYWIFYAYNEAPGGLAGNLANHEGDWERVSVRLDRHDDATEVAYSQHEGVETRPWNEVRKDDTHPIAYVAKGSHALYHSAGSFPIEKVHGAVSDETAEDTPWRTQESLADVYTQPWYGFGGAWGEVGENSHSTGPLGPSCLKPGPPADWGSPCLTPPGSQPVVV
jgi:hypothetical protein